MVDRKEIPASSEADRSVWIILAGLLAAGTLVAVGLMSIINLNERFQAEAGTQPAPAAVTK